MKNRVILTRDQAIDILGAAEHAKALIEQALVNAIDAAGTDPAIDGTEMDALLALQESIETLTAALFPGLPEGDDNT